MEAYYDNLEQQFAKVAKAVTELVNREVQTAPALFDFSQGVIGQNESDTLANALLQVSYYTKYFDF